MCYALVEPILSASAYPLEVTKHKDEDAGKWRETQSRLGTAAAVIREVNEEEPKRHRGS